MDIDRLREFCLSFPHTTENVQWEYALCFKVAGKLFAVTRLEVGPVALSFKCTPENFAELCEREGVIPAPYMARAQWVALRRLDTLPEHELRDCLAESYRLVWEKLPKKLRAELESGKQPKRVAAKKAGKTSPRKTGKRSPAPRKAAKRKVSAPRETSVAPRKAKKQSSGRKAASPPRKAAKKKSTARKRR